MKSVSLPAFDDLTLVQSAVVVKAGFRKSVGLSNLCPHNCTNAPPQVIESCGLTFDSVETAYQHKKARFFESRLFDKANYDQAYERDPTVSSQTFLSDRFLHMTPYEAKRAGGKGAFAICISAMFLNKAKAGRLYDQICKDWFGTNVAVMRGLLDQKFSDSNPAYRDLLLSTNDRIIYEQKSRGGSVWEGGAYQENVTTSGWGLLGDLLMERRTALAVNK